MKPNKKVSFVTDLDTSILLLQTTSTLAYFTYSLLQYFILISFRTSVVVGNYFGSLVTLTPRLHHHDGWGNIHRRSLIRGYKSACIQVFHRNCTHAIHMQSPRAKAPSIVNLHMFMDTCSLTNSFPPASQFIVADHLIGVHVTSDVSHIGFIKYSPYS